MSMWSIIQGAMRRTLCTFVLLGLPDRLVEVVAQKLTHGRFPFGGDH